MPLRDIVIKSISLLPTVDFSSGKITLLNNTKLLSSFFNSSSTVVSPSAPEIIISTGLSSFVIKKKIQII